MNQTDPTADRPFEDEPTEVLEAALDLANTHARQAARFRPARQGDALPAVADLFQAELQHRGERTLPAPQGPEYRQCRVCSHIEPEHELNVGPCLVCDCAGYQLVEASAWIDGDPLMEAIAAAVWEHCRTEGTSLVVDDPRNIAAVVSAVVAPPTDRAALDRLRRLAAETQQQETAGARQQPDGETEAHPAEHTWAAELHDPLADEWVPGTRYPVRDRAVNALNHAKRLGPTWKDGTPVERRLVRATTTYTVEEPAPVAQQPAAAETDEERADREATERDHARGDHTYCGITCEIEMPTEHLRNFVIAKGYPGTRGALDELLRRARAEVAGQQAAAADDEGYGEDCPRECYCHNDAATQA
ncbi:hypothetical protein [Streptomyces sp. NPDC093060]|uniref:hypothetical protein n=1 Tax=Streptomyces sp. NPDC093060 TaxID=3366019 RepID=UPI0037F72E49